MKNQSISLLLLAFALIIMADTHNSCSWTIEDLKEVTDAHKEAYPSTPFVATTPVWTSHHSNILVDNHGLRVHKLKKSSAPSQYSFTIFLKSNKWVELSNHMSESRRRTYLSDKINAEFPNHYVSIFLNEDDAFFRWSVVSSKGFYEYDPSKNNQHEILIVLS